MKVDTLAIDSSGEKRVAVTVPAGAIIKLIRGPLPYSHLIEVRWNGKRLSMFALDVQRRGLEI